MCYNCYWGLPVEVARIYDEAVIALDGDDIVLDMLAHIVWGDHNMGDDSIEWSLDQLQKVNQHYELPLSDVEIVRASLQKLKDVPEAIRLHGDEVDEGYADHPPTIPFTFPNRGK